ncbi:MAG: hypothetical protein ACFB0B_15415 [Thermonemataceae bacterium]
MKLILCILFTLVSTVLCGQYIPPAIGSSDTLRHGQPTPEHINGAPLYRFKKLDYHDDKTLYLKKELNRKQRWPAARRSVLIGGFILGMAHKISPIRMGL